MENSRQNFLGFPLSLQLCSYFVVFQQVAGKSLTKFQLWVTLAISGANVLQFFIIFLQYCTQSTVKGNSHFTDLCSRTFWFCVFYCMKRSSQIYIRLKTNYYSMPISKAICIFPIISAPQTFLNNEKYYCHTRSQHRLFQFCQLV